MATMNMIAFSLTVAYAASVAANEVVFGESQPLITGENAIQFEITDINGDYRKDLVWLTADGDIRYKLRDIQSFQSFQDLQGTTWKLTFDNSGENRWITFENGTGFIEAEDGRQWNIVRYDVTNSQHTFCTAYRSGLSGTSCHYKYMINSFNNGQLQGVYLRTNESWTASQKLN